MTKIAFLAVAIENQFRIGRQYWRHFPEVFREGLRGQIQRVSDMASGVVCWFTGVQEESGAAAPELHCLIKRYKYLRFARLPGRGNQRQASRRNLIARKPRSNAQQNDAQCLRQRCSQTGAHGLNTLTTTCTSILGCSATEVSNEILPLTVLAGTSSSRATSS